MTHKLMLSLATVACVTLASLGPAGATIGDGALSPGLSTPQALAVEKVQFVFHDHNYCWYDGGWKGPGWYWCGYALRRGYGWGGVEGWHGWHHGHHAHHHHPGHHAHPGHHGHGHHHHGGHHHH